MVTPSETRWLYVLKSCKGSGSSLMMILEWELFPDWYIQELREYESLLPCSISQEGTSRVLVSWWPHIFFSVLGNKQTISKSQNKGPSLIISDHSENDTENTFFEAEKLNATDFKFLALHEAPPTFVKNFKQSSARDHIQYFGICNVRSEKYVRTTAQSNLGKNVINKTLSA